MSNFRDSGTVSLSVLMPVYNEVYTVAECVERVIRVKSPYISNIELIIVDNCSTDGTRELLRELKSKYPDKIIYIEHAENQGIGSSVRDAIEKAQNDICIIQGADLEYNPNDFHKIMAPFVHENADAVFGSRYLAGEYSRLLYFRHTRINKFLTFLTDLITDINYTDVETGYKAVRTKLLKSIPLRSRGFDIDTEIAVKIAKRGAHIFEVPISYSGRTVEEGKKINWRDGFHALKALIKYCFVDDIYKDDKYGSSVLVSPSHTPNLSRWTADVLRPHIGKKVLEIGAGIGNMTKQFIPRIKYVVSDVDENYLDYLENYCKNKPYLDVRRIDVARSEDFSSLKDSFDTILCLNVLEHLEDDQAALKNIYSALAEGGKAIILVPQGNWLFSSLDDELKYRRRYSADQLSKVMKEAGFEIETVLSFNKAGIILWLINGKLFGRKRISRIHLKLFEIFIRILRLIDKLLPWQGLSLINIGVKPFTK